MPSWKLDRAAAGLADTHSGFALLLQECSPFQLLERLLQLLLRIHHNRPVPRHRLLQRLARNQQETNPVLVRPALPLHRPGRTAPATGCPASDGGAVVSSHPTPSVGTASGADALQNFPAPEKTYANAWRVVSTGRVSAVPAAPTHPGRPAPPRFRPPARTCPRKFRTRSRTCVPSSSVIVRNIGRLHFLVARRCHLQRRRQVRPQLKAVHAARRVALRHLLVNDPAARRHPLHVARARWRRDCPCCRRAPRFPPGHR